MPGAKRGWDSTPVPSSASVSAPGKYINSASCTYEQRKCFTSHMFTGQRDEENKQSGIRTFNVLWDQSSDVGTSPEEAIALGSSPSSSGDRMPILGRQNSRHSTSRTTPMPECRSTPRSAVRSTFLVVRAIISHSSAQRTLGCVATWRVRPMNRRLIPKACSVCFIDMTKFCSGTRPTTSGASMRLTAVFSMRPIVPTIATAGTPMYDSRASAELDIGDAAAAAGSTRSFAFNSVGMSSGRQKPALSSSQSYTTKMASEPPSAKSRAHTYSSHSKYSMSFSRVFKSDGSSSSAPAVDRNTSSTLES